MIYKYKHLAIVIFKKENIYIAIGYHEKQAEYLNFGLWVKIA